MYHILITLFINAEHIHSDSASWILYISIKLSYKWGLLYIVAVVVISMHWLPYF